MFDNFLVDYILFHELPLHRLNFTWNVHGLKVKTLSIRCDYPKDRISHLSIIVIFYLFFVFFL